MCVYMPMSLQACGNQETTCWSLFSPENDFKLLPLYYVTAGVRGM